MLKIVRNKSEKIFVYKLEAMYCIQIQSVLSAEEIIIKLVIRIIPLNSL